MVTAGAVLVFRVIVMLTEAEPDKPPLSVTDAVITWVPTLSCFY